MGLVVVAAGLWAVASDPLGLGDSGRGRFPNALQWSTPDPGSGEQFRGYEWATAAELMRTGRQNDWPKYGRRVRIVDSETESTGNLVVSVHPIDHFSWAAVARSSNGGCYAILVSHDRVNLQFGETYYARLPAAAKCAGSQATPETVRSQEVPD
jgi:hypothetical protein